MKKMMAPLRRFYFQTFECAHSLRFHVETVVHVMAFFCKVLMFSVARTNWTEMKVWIFIVATVVQMQQHAVSAVFRAELSI